MKIKVSVKRVDSNLFADEIYSIGEFSILVLRSDEKLDVILMSVFFKKTSGMFSILSRKFCLSLVNFGKRSKK